MAARVSIALSLGLIAGGAAPALAQDLCGGIGAMGLWANGTEAASDLSQSSGAFDLTGLGISADNQAVGLFTLSQPATVRLEAMGQGALDPVLDLYDETGRLILNDDDSGGNLAARGELDLAAGRYCVAVRNFSGMAGAVDLRIGLSNRDMALTMGLDGGTGSFAGVTPCTSDTSATPLGASALTMDALGAGVSATHSVSEVPYYRFALSAPSAVTIQAMNETADPYIYLYGADGRLLAENDDFRGLDSQIDMADPLPAGEYCIAMRALSDPDAPVTVSLQSYDPMRAMQQMYESLEASPPIGGSYPITDLGAISGQVVRDVSITGKAQWFLVSLPEDGLILVDAVAMGNSDPILALFDAVGRELAYNDDSGTGLDSQIAQPLGAGSYLIGLRQYDSNAGMVRLVMQRFVAVE
ncbi:DVUA0089 family protein [Rhodobacteraceae bacterium XHP0102]|nr:DVUA0089 family protein [Rhodobacteraceae bacterium XHP0102]